MNAPEFHRWLTTPSPRPLVMGILNITPDSFSDSGAFFSPDKAAAHAREMIEQGADLLDIGGESTRPGAVRVPAAGQIARIMPVLRAVRQVSDIAISIDTTLAEVAAATADAGATFLNDISAGLEDPGILTLAAGRHLPIVLMHMQGQPGTMQDNPTYTDVAREVSDFLVQRASAAVAAGIPPHHILVDPGIGFGKNLDHNLKLLHDLPQLAQLGYRLLLGTSRKRFLGTITGVPAASDRLHGSTASAAWGVLHGASIVRVHDVGPTVQTLKVLAAILGAK